MFGGMDIIEITGRMVLDFWSNPAVEAEIILENGAHGKGMVSLGSSNVGEKENVFVNDWMSEAVLYEDASNQERIDSLLMQALENSGIEEKKGRSWVLAISMAVARAAGAGLGLPLYRYLGGTSAPVMPRPMISMISGKDVEKGIDFSELMIVPCGAKTYGEGLRMGVEIYQTLMKLLNIGSFSTTTSEGGGFVPDLKNTEMALRYLMDASQLSGYTPGRDVLVAIYGGADSLYEKDEEVYRFSKESKKSGIPINRGKKDMMAYYLRLADGFPICAIVDGLWKNDLEGRSEMMNMLEHRVILASDDFHAANGTVVQMEKAGTVTGALELVKKARRAGHKVIVSNGTGETEETFIADLAAAVGAEYIKSGAPCRGECTAKYNELLRIEEFYTKPR